MEDARKGKAKSTRVPFDPKRVSESAYLQDDGSFGFPASAFKQCAVRAGKGLQSRND